MVAEVDEEEVGADVSCYAMLHIYYYIGIPIR